MAKTIIVMSDSHGDREIVAEVKSRYQGQVDAIFHNGDSELSATDSLWEGIWVVRGNCDDDSGYPETQLVQLGDCRVAQTHGHLKHINFTWQYLDLWAQEQAAQLCLFGHLHIPSAVVREGTLFFNPGSISQPRGDIQTPLYAKIDISEDKFYIQYLTREHEVFQSLSLTIA